jgi:hypothetical protein
MNLNQLFRLTIEAQPNEPAIDYFDAAGNLRTLTFAEVDRRAACMASVLRARGLQQGDRLCLYSDGISEQAQGPADSGEQFGTARLRDGLVSRGDLPPERAVEAVIDDLTGWAESMSFVDDVSIVLIEWRGGSAAPAAPARG